MEKGAFVSTAPILSCDKVRDDRRQPPKISNVQGMCLKCNVYLCAVRFNLYHDQGFADRDDNGTEVSVSMDIK